MNAQSAIIIICLFPFICAAKYGPLPESVRIATYEKARVPLDLVKPKPAWKRRIGAIKKKGLIPIIDFESSVTAGKVNTSEYCRQMDENGIALTAFSPQIGTMTYRQHGTLWHEGARRAVGVDPTRCIPTCTAGIYPAFTQAPEPFVAATIAAVEEDNYPMMGEFHIRHDMSPRQYKRGDAVSTRLVGPEPNTTREWR